MLSQKRTQSCRQVRQWEKYVKQPNTEIRHLLILHYKACTVLSLFPLFHHVTCSYFDLSSSNSPLPHLARYLNRKLVSICLAAHLLHSGIPQDNQSPASPLPSIIRGWMSQLSYTPTNLDTITSSITPGTPAQTAHLTSKVLWSAYEELLFNRCFAETPTGINSKVLNTTKTRNEK